MQRCFFLLIFSACFHLLKAQQPDIIATELSFWLNENVPDKIHSRSLIVVNRFTLAQIVMDFQPEEINYIKLREGRLKSDLKFNHKSGKLTIQTTSIRTAICEIEIDYFVEIKSKTNRDYVNQKDVKLGFNLGNIVTGRAIGKSGVFFPGRPEDVFFFKSNITLPRKINCGFPGKLQYVVNHKDKFQSQFWESKTQISSEQFYFVLGDFIEFDEIELQEDLLMEAVSFEARLAEETKKSMMEVLNFLKNYNSKLETENWQDNEILEMDSLATISKSLLWVNEENTNSRWAKNQFIRDQLLFIKASNGDSTIASLWHLEYLTQKEGENWRQEFLEMQWLKWEEGKNENPKLALTSKVLDWMAIKDKASFQKFIVKNDNAMMGEDWKIAKTIIENNRLPEVKIEYFYKNNQENLLITQMDTLIKPIPVAYHFNVYDTDGKEDYQGYSAGNLIDTLSFPQLGAPRAVSFEFDEDFPAKFSIPKSDNYDMYLYGNGDSEKQKKAALYRLFETNNQNLYSTILGLAMDSKEADIRLEAVNRAEVLRIPGQQKLKSIIMELSKYDIDPEVRKQAKLLVLKYYRNK